MSVEINATNFPDAAFRTYISTFDLDEDGWLSDEEIAAVTIISIRNNSEIVSANLSYFTNLQEIDLYKCINMRTLTLGSHPNLTKIETYAANITAYDFSGCLNLEDITLRGKMAETGSIDITQPGINEVLFGSSYPNLTFLGMDGYDGTDIDFSKFPNVEAISLNLATNIETINVTMCSELDHINISSRYGSGVRDGVSYAMLEESNLTAVNCQGLIKLRHINCYGAEKLETLNVSGCSSMLHIIVPLTKSLINFTYDSLPLIEYFQLEGSGLRYLDISRCQVIINVYKNYSQKTKNTEAGPTVIYGQEDENIVLNQHNYRFSYSVGSTINTDQSTGGIIILEQPTDQECLLGEQVSFSVKANNLATQFIWQIRVDPKDTDLWDEYWTEITDADSSVSTDDGISTLTINTTLNNSNRCYRCIVSNSNGSVASNIVRLSADFLPIITTQPASTTVIEGETAIFNVEASGDGLSYQWQTSIDGENWTDLAAASTNSFQVQATKGIDGRQYRCVVTNNIGSTESDPATLTVTEDTRLTKPIITTQPVSATVAEGISVTFAVSASGQDLSYQWQVFQNNSWTNIDGASLSVYMVNATKQLNGSRYRCVVSNAAGAIYSDPAILTVTTGASVSTPRILTQPKSVNADLGELVTFWIRADGGDLTYQWQRINDGTWYDITGATGSSYQLIARTEIHNTQYRCVVTNTAGAAYSSSATLSIRAGQELSFYGYHSIIISGKNTYGEWEMYPTSRPHIAPPEVKTNYVDLPGADGGLDYTDLLTGEPRFGYRKGSWEFLLIPQEKWASVYRSLVQYLHGRRHTVILEDDPNFVYSGRLSVNEWKSEPHNSLITIDYILEPFARDISGEQEDERTNEILDAANELLSKQENAGMVIAKVPGGAVLIDPSMLFENGDNIAY